MRASSTPRHRPATGGTAVGRKAGMPPYGRTAITAFRRRLLAWFARHARPLPWRRTRDPYRVLVSEFMLQQTQVGRVEQFYSTFLERYPSLSALARARPKAVREAWEGLGYYARARNLHALVKRVSQSGGRVPDDPAELIKLPGVGRYTAGAVACFAYEKPVPAVDTNVARVIRRVFIGERGAQSSPRRSSTNGGGAPRGPAPRSVLSLTWRIAASLVPKDGRRAWRFNQAIMELGATVCVARKPRCNECPVLPGCNTGRRARRD